MHTWRWHSGTSRVSPGAVGSNFPVRETKKSDWHQQRAARGAAHAVRTVVVLPLTPFCLEVHFLGGEGGDIMVPSSHCDDALGGGGGGRAGRLSLKRARMLFALWTTSRSLQGGSNPTEVGGGRRDNGANNSGETSPPTQTDNDIGLGNIAGRGKERHCPCHLESVIMSMAAAKANRYPSFGERRRHQYQAVLSKFCQSSNRTG